MMCPPLNELLVSPNLLLSFVMYANLSQIPNANSSSINGETDITSILLPRHFTICYSYQTK